MERASRMKGRACGTKRAVVRCFVRDGGPIRSCARTRATQEAGAPKSWRDRCRKARRSRRMRRQGNTRQRPCTATRCGIRTDLSGRERIAHYNVAHRRPVPCRPHGFGARPTRSAPRPISNQWTTWRKSPPTAAASAFSLVVCAPPLTTQATAFPGSTTQPQRVS